MNQNTNKFCIITTQRSGSTWLISLLESHPDIKAFYEIFLDRWPGNDFLISFHEFKQANFGIRPEKTFRYLDQLNIYPGKHHTIGFKIMYNQLGRYPEVLAKFALDRYKIIHLIRDNHLDIAISAASMQQNKLVHAKKIVHANPIILEPESLIKGLSRLETQLNLARLLLKIIPNPVLEIKYEELCENQNQALGSIVKFLGMPLDAHNFVSDRQKINRGSYQQKIANYEQIVQTLTGTKFEKFLFR